MTAITLWRNHWIISTLGYIGYIRLCGRISFFLVYLFPRGRVLRKTTFCFAVNKCWLMNSNQTLLLPSSQKHLILFQDWFKYHLILVYIINFPHIITGLSSVFHVHVFVILFITVHFGYLYRCLSLYIEWWFSWDYHPIRLPRCLGGKESACQCRRRGFDPWIGKITWRRKWQSIPVFLPGKFPGRKSLVGCSRLGHKESDMTEWQSTHACTFLWVFNWEYCLLPSKCWINAYRIELKSEKYSNSPS